MEFGRIFTVQYLHDASPKGVQKHFAMTPDYTLTPCPKAFCHNP